MSILKNLNYDEIKHLEQNITNIMMTNIAKRMSKKYFGINLEGDLVEELTRYDCKKIGFEDVASAINLTKDRIRLGLKPRFDPRIDGNWSFYGYAAIPILGFPFLPAWLTVATLTILALETRKKLLSLPYYDTKRKVIFLRSMPKDESKIEILSHELCHSLHYNFGKFSKTEPPRSEVEDLECEGLASCLGVDTLFDWGYVKAARLSDMAFMAQGYFCFNEEVKKRQKSIENDLKLAEIKDDNIRKRMEERNRNIETIRSDLDQIFARDMLHKYRGHYLGYVLIRSLSLDYGEEKVYSDVFKTGLKQYLKI